MSFSLRIWSRRVPLAPLLAAVVLHALACAAATKSEAPETQAASVPMDALWIEPHDLASRNLFGGPGGIAQAPVANSEFQFKERDTSGHSSGYRVVDAKGLEWKVKTGDEAQSEVAVSRILWAIGYHQPAVYFVANWRLTGGPAKAEAAPGRFRLETGIDTTGTWSWEKNPFVGTQPFRGLVVVNVLLNNWDLAPSNNRIYNVQADGGERMVYVVQDVGGALGKTRWPLGSRNRVEHFEEQGFLLETEPGRVKFDFHGARRGMLRDIGPGDVVWACRLLARLSDKQLEDAFTAAGYAPDIRARFIAKIRTKIQQGLALEGKPGAAS
jgi:hypothetical protein